MTLDFGIQGDEHPVEYAGEGGPSKGRDGQGRRRPVGHGSPQHREDGESGGDGDDDDEVTTKDSK